MTTTAAELLRLAAANLATWRPSEASAPHAIEDLSVRIGAECRALRRLLPAQHIARLDGITQALEASARLFRDNHPNGRTLRFWIERTADGFFSEIWVAIARLRRLADDLEGKPQAQVVAPEPAAVTRPTSWRELAKALNCSPETAKRFMEGATVDHGNRVRVDLAKVKDPADRAQLHRHFSATPNKPRNKRTVKRRKV